MTFVAPTILLGTLLIAAPIVLHLIMRQQPKRLEFPALRLLVARSETNRRKLQLRNLILLLLRCAAILLLALALARPSLQSGGILPDQEAPVAAALVFDTAPRMEYRQENQTRLEAARETADWLVEQFPSESEVWVLDSRAAAGSFPLDAGAARDRIGRLSGTTAPRPLGDTLEDALELVQESVQQRKEVYVFSDLSQAAWSSEASARWRERLRQHPEIGVYLIDVGVEQPKNASLGELRLSAQSVAEGTALALETSLAQVGGDGDRAVELLVANAEGKLEKRGEQSRTLVGGQPQSIAFTLGSLPPGTHQGLVRVVGEDGLAADDVRYFSVAAEAKQKVLLAAPAPADDYALWVRRALETRFECRVVALDELGGVSLEEFAAGFLLDPGPLSSTEWQRLAEFVTGGRGLAIVLGRNAQVEAFNERAAQEVLPAPLARQFRAGGRLVYLAPESLDHPVLAPFRSRQGSLPWEDFPVEKYWQLGELPAGANVLVPYSNGDPAVVERPLGKGRVMLFTTSLSDAASRQDAWNYIMTGAGQTAPWPGMMLTILSAQYLAGGSDARLNYLPGESAVVPLGGERALGMFLLATPSGERLRQTAGGEQDAVTISVTEWPGNYQLRSGSDQGGFARGFSVNLPPAATQLDRLDTEQLKALLDGLPIRVARGRDQIDRSVSLGRVGLELYPFLIALVAIVLAAEHLLANRFHDRPPTPQPRKATSWLARTWRRSAASSPLPDLEVDKLVGPGARV